MKCTIGTRCEKCGSTNITKELIQSYSMSKGLVGQAIFGAGGSVMGVNGKNDYIYNCQDCGHTSKKSMDMYTNSDIEKAIADPIAYATIKAEMQKKYPNIDWSGEDIGAIKLSAGEIIANAKNLQIEGGHLISIDLEYKITATTVIVPNGVTHIDKNAFISSRRLKRVQLPEGLISIDAGAFSICEALTSINIPSTVKYIGSEAFSNCKSLRHIYIPKNVEVIGKEIFQYCNNNLTVECEVENKLNGWHKNWHRISSTYLIFNEYAKIKWNVSKHIIIQKSASKPQLDNFEIRDGVLVRLRNTEVKTAYIPNTVTSIGKYAFYGCNKLTSVTIGNSVTSIGKYAFYGCNKLTSVTIGNSVTNIGDSAFYGCSGLSSITVGENNTVYKSEGDCLLSKDGKTLILGCKNSLIPNGVTSINTYAFRDRKELTSITIPNSVTSIGAYAFSGCSGITSITIPDSVTNIAGSFKGCSGLTSITVDENNTVFKSKDDCLLSKDGKTLILGCKNSIIPNSVTSIGDNAFDGCVGLTSITIPNSVTSIGAGTFNGCIGLTSIIIPNGVTRIGNYAFDGCSKLTSITIPKGVTNVGDFVFDGCKGLTTIYCEAEEQLKSWFSWWKGYCEATVIWGYKGNNNNLDKGEN